MRAATSNCRGVEVAIAVADCRFDMAALGLDGFEIPTLAGGVREEVPELPAKLAIASQLAVPRPIGRRGKWFRDSGTQVRDTRFPQADGCRYTRRH